MVGRQRLAAPRIDPNVQRVYWRLGDSLAQALRAPTPDNPEGDSGWTVSGAAVGGWKVDHPDLPMVRDDEGANKEILLQLHVAQEGSDWLVVAQNKVVGPDQHASPRALVVARQDQPPGPDWNLDRIADAAANFFRQQKEALKASAQSVTPRQQPGSAEPPMLPGASGPIMSNRRRYIASLL